MDVTSTGKLSAGELATGRTIMGYSQRTFARYLGPEVDNEHMQSWERGKFPIPDWVADKYHEAWDRWVDLVASTCAGLRARAEDGDGVVHLEIWRTFDNYVENRTSNIPHAMHLALANACFMQLSLAGVPVQVRWVDSEWVDYSKEQ